MSDQDSKVKTRLTELLRSILWLEEAGQQLELRVHLVPAEVAEDF